MKATLVGELNQTDEVDARSLVARGLHLLHIHDGWLWASDVPLGVDDLEDLMVAWEHSLDVERAFRADEKNGPFGSVVLCGDSAQAVLDSAVAQCGCECGRRWSAEERVDHKGPGCPGCSEEAD